jgi:predicted nucleotidyltransferase
VKVVFTLSEIRDPINRLRSVSNKIILYGSCADGTDSKERDIDLLVLVNDKKEVRRVIQLERRAVKRRVPPMILSPVEFSTLKEKDPAFYEQVLKGITVWESEERV